MPKEGPGGERTEPLSPRRRNKLREEGKVPKSADLSNAVLLTVGVVLFYVITPYLLNMLIGVQRYFFQELATFKIETVDDCVAFTWYLLFLLAQLILPILVPLLVAAVAGSVLQFGFMTSAKSLTPSFDKLNPMNGLKRFFTPKTYVEMAKSLVRITVMVVIVYCTVHPRFYNLMLLMVSSPAQILSALGQLAWLIALRGMLAMLIFALLDYAYQRWTWERDNRMTKREVREEMKDVEGDPHIRGRIKSIQRQIATQRMMRAVPEADVVITNPTELAIALRYNPLEMPAPRVVAKGARLIAQKIREIAAEHRVPIVENKPLAQALFRTVEVGGDIPADLFKAVAEVLAYIYQIDRRVEKLRERRRLAQQSA